MQSDKQETSEVANPNERIVICVNAALKNGDISSFDLALKLWPQDEYPKMWRYADHGGPYVWNMQMGRIIKRLSLVVYWDKSTKMISR